LLLDGAVGYEVHFEEAMVAKRGKDQSSVTADWEQFFGGIN
jgi:hypothetical protein